MASFKDMFLGNINTYKKIIFPFLANIYILLLFSYSNKYLLLGIKASGHYLGQVKASYLYIRQVAVMYHCSISVVRNLKFLTPFSKFLTINLFNHHCNLLK